MSTDSSDARMGMGRLQCEEEVLFVYPSFEMVESIRTMCERVLLCMYWVVYNPLGISHSQRNFVEVYGSSQIDVIAKGGGAS